MNKTILLGRITKDIELKSTTSGKEVCQFTIAINRTYTNQNGEYESDFINCVAYGKTAEVISKYTKKGDRLVVEGRIQTRNYEKNGNKIYVTEIIVETINFVETKKQENKISYKAEEIDNIPTNMELPF